ncbi:MAG: carbonic anhydrase family protein [Cyanobacteria bacterium J06626_23]
MNRRFLLKVALGSLVGNGLGLRWAQSARAWSYIGSDGPDHWGELSPDYAACATGRHQSPIDLGRVEPVPMDSLQFDYRPTPLTLVNTGHTVRIDYASGSRLILEGQPFELLQFHFHDPSEHTRSGQHQPMEIHFVHRNAQTQDLVVLSVLVRAGQENPTLQKMWPYLPSQINQPSTVMREWVNARDLLPDTATSVFRYSGSLTTPPCSETVTWLVLGEPVTASLAQISQFYRLIGENARPTQSRPT